MLNRPMIQIIYWHHAVPCKIEKTCVKVKLKQSAIISVKLTFYFLKNSGCTVLFFVISDVFVEFLL